MTAATATPGSVPCGESVPDQRLARSDGVGEETLWKIGYPLGPAHGYSRGMQSAGHESGVLASTKKRQCPHSGERPHAYAERSSAERTVRRRKAQTGDEAKFDKLTPEQLADPTFVATMPIVRASVIRALCLRKWEDVRVYAKGGRIIGVYIKGACQYNTRRKSERLPGTSSTTGMR